MQNETNILRLIAASALCIALAACGDQGPSNSPSDAGAPARDIGSDIWDAAGAADDTGVLYDTPICTPRACQPAECGFFPDGCGGSVDCGRCDEALVINFNGLESSVLVGQTSEFGVVVRLEGVVVPNPDVSIESSDPSVLAVNGLEATGVRRGEVTLTATYMDSVRSAPVAVHGFESLVAGPERTCARSDGRSIWCLGGNAEGERGDPVLGVPVSTWLTTAAQLQFRSLDAGTLHTCGRGLEGDAFCWGSNAEGQLGAPAVTDRRSAPTRVPGLPIGLVEVVAAGGSTTCTVADSRVFCWGSNASGLIGTAMASEPTPVELVGFPAFDSLSMGVDFACGLDAGTAFCWGAGASGQLGDGQALATRSAAGPVDSTSRYTQLSAGLAHICGVTDAGEIECWGDDRQGQTTGVPTTFLSSPSRVSTLPSASYTKVSSGHGHSCAVADGATVRCWGSNEFHQLGSVDPAARLADVSLPTGTSVAGVAAGGAHTCAVSDEGVAYCWGDSTMGQAGAGAVPCQTDPARRCASAPNLVSFP